jgi:hypothetical protein
MDKKWHKLLRKEDRNGSRKENNRENIWHQEKNSRQIFKQSVDVEKDFSQIWIGKGTNSGLAFKMDSIRRLCN